MRRYIGGGRIFLIWLESLANSAVALARAGRQQCQPESRSSASSVTNSGFSYTRFREKQCHHFKAVQPDPKLLLRGGCAARHFVDY